MKKHYSFFLSLWRYPLNFGTQKSAAITLDKAIRLVAGRTWGLTSIILPSEKTESILISAPHFEEMKNYKA